MGNNQAMSNAKQKAESTGVFLSTLLLLRVFVWTAPRRWEWRNTGLFFVRYFVWIFVWIYAVFSLFRLVDFDENMRPDLNICRITFYLNLCFLQSFHFSFEYMSYYLLLELLPRGYLELVWMYVVLLFTQTHGFEENMRSGLNICRIAFYSNSLPTIRMPEAFEYMSYYLWLC